MLLFYGEVGTLWKYYDPNMKDQRPYWSLRRPVPFNLSQVLPVVTICTSIFSPDQNPCRNLFGCLLSRSLYSFFKWNVTILSRNLTLTGKEFLCQTREGNGGRDHKTEYARKSNSTRHTIPFDELKESKLRWRKDLRLSPIFPFFFKTSIV